MDYPVVFFVFNRPEVTKTTFQAIEAHRPGRLYLVADGPRTGVETDVWNCQRAREIASAVTWPCEVHKLFAVENLGLKRRIETGLDWVFSREEAAIILEDDCLASKDFFSFANQMLTRFACHDNIFAITGNNFQYGRRRGTHSYYFSKYLHVWGWATWSRSWREYESGFLRWSRQKDSEQWQRIMPTKKERAYWEDILHRVKTGEISSWAYAMSAAIWARNGLVVTPQRNLVSNLGFGSEGTNTKTANHVLGNLPREPFEVVSDPDEIIQNRRADSFVFRRVFGGEFIFFAILRRGLAAARRRLRS